jgi:hypothetical protein
MNFSSDIAFTPAVKAVQERKGSRADYARMEDGGSWETRITPDLKASIETQTSVFLAWDANCPQHIPLRFDAADVAATLADRDRRISELEAQLQKAVSDAAALSRTEQG